MLSALVYLSYTNSVAASAVESTKVTVFLSPMVKNLQPLKNFKNWCKPMMDSKLPKLISVYVGQVMCWVPSKVVWRI